MQATQFKQKKRMYTVETTKIFDDWLRSLKDMRVKATIITRLERAENGNLGDHKTVGKGVSEMRIAYRYWQGLPPLLHDTRQYHYFYANRRR